MCLPNSRLKVLLYIGIQDDGTVVGVDDPDGVSLQISNQVSITFN